MIEAPYHKHPPELTCVKERLISLAPVAPRKLERGVRKGRGFEREGCMERESEFGKGE